MRLQQRPEEGSHYEPNRPTPRSRSSQPPETLEINVCCLSQSWYLVASLVAQMVEKTPSMRETWVPSLGWENPLEEAMATHSSILTWRIPVDRGTWWATVHGVAKSWT